MQNSEEIWRLVDAKQDEFNALSDRVWEIPELCYGEFKSCAEHTAMLEAQGFRVTQNVAGIPTAVMGEAGEDGPVIAILGEYDALPGLSQEATVLRVEALHAAGRDAEAARLGQRLLDTEPGSAHAKRIRSLLATLPGGR